MRKPRHPIIATLTIAVAAGLGLGLLEGLTRLLFPTFDPSGRFEFRHQVGSLRLGQPGADQRQIKNTGDYDVRVRINRHGLRDVNDVSQATPDDLIVVGDSFAWGWGVEVEDRFSDRLQVSARRRRFNVSAPTNLAGYAALLDYARSLGARIGQVVLAVCLENDLRDYGRVDQRASNDATDWKQWLAERSAGYLLLTTVIHQSPWLNALAVGAGSIVPNIEGIPKNAFEPDAIESSAAKLFDLTRQYRLLVVLIPSRALWVGHGRATEDRVHRGLAASLAHRGVQVLDLRPLLEADANPLAYHFANDGHWNPRGHALAAEAIGRCLAREATTC